MRAARSPLAVAVVGGALVGLPFVGLPAFYESFLYLLLSAIVLATSWNVLSGYSGYFSFGHGAFFGVGVYTTAALAGKLGWPFLWTLPLAALAAAALGVALGAVVFRVRALRGELFALLTLAITFVLATIALNTVDGGPGIQVMVDMDVRSKEEVDSAYEAALRHKEKYKIRQVLKPVMAYSVVFALIGALVLSLTLVPLLASAMRGALLVDREAEQLL